MFVLETPTQPYFKDGQRSLRFDIRLASNADISKFERFDRSSGRRVTERFRVGHMCVVAEENGKIVSYAWICLNRAYVEEIETEIQTAPGSAYLYDEYTDPEYRGKGILPALLMRTQEYLFSNGIHEIYELVNPNNFPSLRSHQKIGSHKIGKVTLFRVVKSKRYRCASESFEDSYKMERMLSVCRAM